MSDHPVTEELPALEKPKKLGKPYSWIMWIGFILIGIGLLSALVGVTIAPIRAVLPLHFVGWGSLVAMMGLLIVIIFADKGPKSFLNDQHDEYYPKVGST